MSQISLGLTDDWDIDLDPDTGGLALTTGRARIAQDVACYERVFAGEPYYAADEGVPYLNGELGALPPMELVAARANARARLVPGVDDAATALAALEQRTLKGTVYATTVDGETINVAI